jgi:predicted RNA binding protein YcfA (HicA-like mRNA interferase family)
MAGNEITYGELHRLLLGLGFECVPAKPSWRAYRHSPSGTVVLLAGRRPGHPTRRPDVSSVRRHLAENGILTEAEFDRMLARAS